MAKKLVLIDPDLLGQLLVHKAPPPPPANPTLRELSNLDTKMDKTLAQPTPEDPRATIQQYNNMLHSYNVHHDKYKKTPLLPPALIQSKATQDKVQQDQETDSEPKDPWEEEIIDSVPLTLKGRAKLLIRRIKNSEGKLGWNSQGQLTRGGVALPNTNIVDLVGDVLRRRKTVGIPQGAEHFMSGLHDINVPKEAVGNKARLKLPYRRHGPQPIGTPTETGAAGLYDDGDDDWDAGQYVDIPYGEEEEEEEDTHLTRTPVTHAKRYSRTTPRYHTAKRWISWPSSTAKRNRKN